MGQHSLDACSLNAPLSCLGIRHGPIQSKQSRTRAGQGCIQRRTIRRYTRRFRRSDAHQFTLDFTQGGTNRKDDSFKVVFYPGADKREKGILGQIVLQIASTSVKATLFFLRAIQIFTGCAEDTGGAGLGVGGRQSKTQPLQPICSGGIGQALICPARLGQQSIPVPKCLRRRNPHRRQSNHARRLRQIRQRRHLLAAPLTEHRPAQQKQRNVRADRCSEFQPLDARNDEVAYRRNRRIEIKLTDR